MEILAVQNPVKILQMIKFIDIYIFPADLEQLALTNQEEEDLEPFYEKCCVHLAT